MLAPLPLPLLPRARLILFFFSLFLSLGHSVVIMSSILEHMCADVLQQTATQIKFPSTGMDTIPYWNLLPPKKPIKEVLTSMFTKVLEKGWVDSRSIHIFDTLLHMGGVYWFCNNLVKVWGAAGRWPRPPGLPGLARALVVQEMSGEGSGCTPVPLSPAPCLAGAAEGDEEGAHAAGRGAALCHLLPGHAAADADPAGSHPAQFAHGLLQVAHPHGPAGESAGQVSPGAVLAVPLGARGSVCGDGEMLRGVWVVPRGAQHPNSHPQPQYGAGRSCWLPPRAVWDGGSSSATLLCPQALRVVRPELLLLPQQGPGVQQAEEEAPGGYRGASDTERGLLGGAVCPRMGADWEVTGRRRGAAGTGLPMQVRGAV